MKEIEFDTEAIEKLGITYGVSDCLEGEEELVKEICQKADDIMDKAYTEFYAFLEKKGVENRMGMLFPREDDDEREEKENE